MNIFVAADLYGQKTNLELSFPYAPTLTELQRLVETTFAVESSLVRPTGSPFHPFKMSSFTMYDDVGLQWIALDSSSLLCDGCQLYAFQPGIQDSQQQIPPPRLPTAGPGPAPSQQQGAGTSSENGSNGGGQTTRRLATPSPPRQFSPATAPLPGPAYGQSLGALDEAAARYGAPASVPRSFHAASAAAAAAGPPPAGRVLPSSLQIHTSTTPVASSHASVLSGGATPPTSMIHAAGGGSGQELLVVSTARQKLYADPNPSADLKVRLVFEEIDASHNRRVEGEAFRRVLRALNIDLPAGVAADLFLRADRDGDGYMSFNEFERFAQLYPTLVDAMYFRLKEAHEDRRRRDTVERRRAAVTEVQQREAALSVAARDIRRRLEECEGAVLVQDQELQGKLLKEKECRARLHEGKKDADAQRALVQQRTLETEDSREKERSRHGALVEAQRAVDAAQKKLAEHEMSVARAQEKEEQLERMLEAARKETDAARKGVQAGVDELRKWRDHEQQLGELFKESQRAVQKAATTIVGSEKELEALQGAVAGAEEALLDAQRDTARAAHRRDEEENLLRAQRDREIDHQHRVAEVEAAMERARAALEAADKDYAAYRARRQLIEQQEKPLIDQEIRLRDQRYALEDKEARFHHESASFYNAAGRAGQHQSLARAQRDGGSYHPHHGAAHHHVSPSSTNSRHDHHGGGGAMSPMSPAAGGGGVAALNNGGDHRYTSTGHHHHQQQQQHSLMHHSSSILSDARSGAAAGQGMRTPTGHGGYY